MENVIGIQMLDISVPAREKYQKLVYVPPPAPGSGSGVRLRGRRRGPAPGSGSGSPAPEVRLRGAGSRRDVLLLPPSGGRRRGR